MDIVLYRCVAHGGLKRRGGGGESITVKQFLSALCADFLL